MELQTVIAPGIDEEALEHKLERLSFVKKAVVKEEVPFNYLYVTTNKELNVNEIFALGVLVGQAR